MDFLNSDMVEQAKKKLEKKQTENNYKYDEFLRRAEDLFNIRINSVNNVKKIESLVNQIKNTPVEFNKTFQKINHVYHEKFNIEVNDIIQSQKDIDVDQLVKTTGGAISATLAGAGFATLAPTAAMAIATTFGVASTGTAISALTGAAATNAALAWLGGGAIVAGGGGMASGGALIGILAGPVAWAIGGTILLGTAGYALWNKSEKNEELAKKINEEIRNVEKRTIELKLINEETNELRHSTEALVNRLRDEYVFIEHNIGERNYNDLTETMQYKLIALVNSVETLCALLQKVPGKADN